MSENRLNITWIGLFSGATMTPVVLWIWDGWLVPATGWPAMPALVAAWAANAVTFGAQWLDRLSKRESQHVLNKYGPSVEQKDDQ
jgi:hypothetical protein